MRLPDAVSFVLAIGPHKGRAIGWIVKCVPDGVEYLAKLYTSDRLHDDTREALRSLFVAPAMQAFLLRKLGRAHRQSIYMLAQQDGRCAACDSPMAGQLDERFCVHGNLRPGSVATYRCPCGHGYSSRPSTHYVHCDWCDTMPLLVWAFSREKEAVT